MIPFLSYLQMVECILIFTLETFKISESNLELIEIEIEKSKCGETGSIKYFFLILPLTRLTVFLMIRL